MTTTKSDDRLQHAGAVIAEARAMIEKLRPENIDAFIEAEVARKVADAPMPAKTAGPGVYRLLD